MTELLTEWIGIRYAGSEARWKFFKERSSGAYFFTAVLAWTSKRGHGICVKEYWPNLPDGHMFSELRYASFTIHSVAPPPKRRYLYDLMRFSLNYDIQNTLKLIHAHVANGNTIFDSHKKDVFLWYLYNSAYPHRDVWTPIIKQNP